MSKLRFAAVLLFVGPAVVLADGPAAPKRHFQAASTKSAEAWQQESRQLLLQLLKMDDLEKSRQAAGSAIPFDEKTLRTEDHEKYTLREIEITSTKTRRIKALVTMPKDSAGKHAAVVCIHGHGGSRFIVYDHKSLYRGFADELASRGFVTISTDVGQHEVYERGRTLMGERLWDVLRCADYVAAMPAVDNQRLGCAGLSLGGEMAMWLGAMDTRMKATVSAGFLTDSANLRRGHCMCWDFPGLTDNFEFSDIYSLIAPRALQCQNGQQEPSRGGFPVELAERAMTDIHRAYSVFDKKDAATLYVHPEGHVFNVKAGIEFLQKRLVKP